MSEKFQNKYRIPSARRPDWDYSWEGSYFITICCIDHECLLGRIEDEKMEFSSIGKIVFEEWVKSFTMRAELFSDVDVIMPNHIHAILRIGDVKTLTGTPPRRDARPCVSTVPTDQPTNTGVAFRSPKSISSFVAGFKSAATTLINVHRNLPREPVWQPRFHDHVIRNQDEYNRIEQYIKNNPANWKDDIYYK